MNPQIMNYISMVIPILLALTVHEYSHGYIAYRLGDHTAKNMGRLTLNPISHIDPIGLIMLFVIGMGWAKPVPINIYAFKKPKRDLALSAAAGPASNFIMAAITGLNYFASYQAEAPMLLESAIDPFEKGSYDFEVMAGKITFTSLIRQLVEDIHRGISTDAMAAKFHHSLVRLIVRLAMEIREESGLDRIVLGGGSFQNSFLTEKVVQKLENELFKVYLPRSIPVNDQGIAAGQLAIGAHRRKLM